MYNTLTVKTDILELGNLYLSKPEHISYFSKNLNDKRYGGWRKWILYLVVIIAWEQ